MGAAALLLALAGVGAGCPFGAARERREEDHPLMRRAQALKQAKDLDGAVAAYERVLAERPGLSMAHLQLGLIFDQEPRNDYARAIYHYERYLELRPDADKRERVEGLLRNARLSLVAAFRENTVEPLRRLGELQRENEALRKQVDDLVRQNDDYARRAAARPVLPGDTPPRPTPAPSGAAAVRAPVPAPAPPPARTYTVQPGDTLSTIAGRMYNNRNAWQKILDANRTLLRSERDVRVGQVLTIPP